MAKTAKKRGRPAGKALTQPPLPSNGKLKFDDNIPLPETMRSNSIASIIDFAAMKINQSCFVVGKTAQALQSAANNWADKALDQKRINKMPRFVSRTWKEGTNEGARIWRVE